MEKAKGDGRAEERQGGDRGEGDIDKLMWSHGKRRKPDYERKN